MGFSDFAGSTLVHSTGGWAALAGAIVIGARRGKYGPAGRVNPMPGANLPLATLGALWFGWFGFNGGSQLALGSVLDASAMAIVYVNTNLAAAPGVVVAMLLTQALYKKMDLTLCLNGAIGGLVAITAGPDLQHHGIAMIVGGVGGALVVFSVPLLDKFRIDDVVGAIPAHLRDLGNPRGRHLRRGRVPGPARGRRRRRRLRFRGQPDPLDRSQGHDRRSARGRGGIGRPRPDRARAGSVFGRGSQLG